MFPPIPASPRRLLPAVVLTVFLAYTAALHAQVQVELKLSRPSYILYEPLIATVTVTNNAGRDITLLYYQCKKWLIF